ncbi:ABC transporter permease, partial [Streptomyces sp. SID11233]|nr:ABC transporter permease [Streptomyces sp. SID11233]
RALDAGLSLHPYRDHGAAREAIEEQKVFAVLSRDGERARLDLSGASGASVAQLLAEAAPKVGKETGTPVTVRDVNPLQSG